MRGKLFPEAPLTCLCSSSVIYNHTRSVDPRMGGSLRGNHFPLDPATALADFPKGRTNQCLMQDHELLTKPTVKWPKMASQVHGNKLQPLAQYWVLYFHYGVQQFLEVLTISEPLFLLAILHSAERTGV